MTNDEQHIAWHRFDRYGWPEPELPKEEPTYRTAGVRRCECGTEFSSWQFSQWFYHDCEYRREG